MNRRDRRGVNAKLRGSRAAAAPNMQAELQRVASAHNALAKAFNQNTEAFLQSMTGADAMIWVLRMALNDMLNGKVRTIDAEGDKQVDLAAYLTLYKEHVTAEAVLPATTTVIENGTSDAPIIFGGDS